jgi:hypothetical protein
MLWDRDRRGYRVNPNELSEWAVDRQERVEAVGWGHSDSTLLPPTDPSGASGYQRRGLTEELPSFQEAFDKAKEMVDARIEQIDRMRRLRSRMAPVSGERGDTKVELVWLSPPVPDWNLLREMVLDGLMSPQRFQRMTLAHLGFNASAMPELVDRTDPFGLNSPRVQQAVAGQIVTNRSRERIETNKNEFEKQKLSVTSQLEEKKIAATAAAKRKQASSSKKQPAKKKAKTSK